MVLAEHQLLDTAESIVEEAKKDRANGIAEQEIRKRLSVRLRNVFPEADVHVISDVADAAMRKAGKAVVASGQENKNVQYSKLLMGASQGLIKFAAGVKLKPVIKGAENIPRSGPVVIASRHYHAQYDQALMIKLSPRRLHFMVTSILFPKYGALSGLLRKGGLVPVRRDATKEMKNKELEAKVAEFEKTFSNVSSFRQLMERLNQGEAIVIFPEGSAQIGGEGKAVASPYQQPKRGYVFLAYMMYKNHGKRVPIVPVGLDYGDSKDYKYCKARAGKPVYIPFEKFANKDKRAVDEMIDYYTNAIFGQIKFLSENWDGEPPDIAYPGEKEIEMPASAALQPIAERKGVIQQAEEAVAKRFELAHKSSLEEYGIPIIKAVLERRINLVSSGMQAKAVYAKERCLTRLTRQFFTCFTPSGAIFWKESTMKCL